MEAVVMHGSLDQSISPYKSHLKNSKKNHQFPSFSNSSDAFWASHFSSTGILQPPPPPFLSQSYPPYTPRQSSQPPLLPLPAAALRRSASVANKKVGSNPSRTRDPSLASKKSRSPKKEGKNSPGKSMGANARKPDNGGGLRSVVVEQLNIFSGSATFAISPPPSSLPLPTFPMRPKLSCKAEAAAGVDAGATDDLRRLLRLR